MRVSKLIRAKYLLQILSSFVPGDRVEVPDPVEVLLDVLSVVRDAGRRDHGVAQDL